MPIKALTILCATILVGQSLQAADFSPSAFVAAHNRWRAQVGVTEQLEYSTSLAAQAQAWANHLKRANHCRMRHSEPDGQYGENLAWAGPIRWSDGHTQLQRLTPEEVVDTWGSEKANYDYQTNTCAPGKVCGHYTQVVWRATTRVGCGMAVCENTKDQVWVCRYQPPGNWVGERPY
jgi:pathogenesis-related protein 1